MDNRHKMGQIRSSAIICPNTKPRRFVNQSLWFLLNSSTQFISWGYIKALLRNTTYNKSLPDKFWLDWYLCQIANFRIPAQMIVPPWFLHFDHKASDFWYHWHYIKTFSVVQCNNHHYCKKFRNLAILGQNFLI